MDTLDVVLALHALLLVGVLVSTVRALRAVRELERAIDEGDP